MLRNVQHLTSEQGGWQKNNVILKNNKIKYDLKELFYLPSTRFMVSLPIYLFTMMWIGEKVW